MARKNDRVRRSNDKGRLSRRQQGQPRREKHLEVPRVRVEELVMPDGQCRFQSPRKPKARFGTEEKAAEALKQAQRQRARTGSTHVEKRYYKCPEGGCGGYHLTARETWDHEVWKLRRKQHEERDLNG